MAFIDVNGKRFKNFMAKLYGWGASVVILGAMFKILHLPGADFMLVVGLTTEAVIFFFSAFEKPHQEVDWTLVYPELAGMEDIDGLTEGSSRNKANNSLTVTQELDNMLEEAKVDKDLIESLGMGLRKFGDTALQLNETASAATATKDYSQQLGLASKNMESLNALYAVQLESSAGHVELQNALMENLQGSVQESSKLNTEVTGLIDNMKNLNSVYGGMLGAMNGGKK